MDIKMTTAFDQTRFSLLPLSVRRMAQVDHEEVPMDTVVRSSSGNGHTAVLLTPEAKMANHYL